MVPTFCFKIPFLLCVITDSYSSAVAGLVKINKIEKKKATKLFLMAEIKTWKHDKLMHHFISGFMLLPAEAAVHLEY